MFATARFEQSRRMKRSEFAVAVAAKKMRIETSETPPRDPNVVAFDVAKRLTDRPSPSVEATGHPGDVKSAGAVWSSGD